MTRIAQFNHSETPPPSIWGEPGDQLKVPGEYETDYTFCNGELNIVPWYAGDWVYHLRPIKVLCAESLAECAESAARNINVGYSQTNDRESFYRELEAAGWDPRKIKEPCNGDCSSGFAALSTAAGMDMPRDLYTGNMYYYAQKSGKYIISAVDKPLFRVSPDYLLPGDVLLRPATEGRGGHTLTVIDAGDQSYITAKGTVAAGTWNLRSDTFVDRLCIIDILSGGDRLIIYPPAVRSEGATWYMVECPSMGLRGWLSSIAIVFDHEAETIRDTWQRVGWSTAYSAIQVVPAGQRLVWTGVKKSDYRGVYWYEVLYCNKWGWISGNNAEIIAK